MAKPPPETPHSDIDGVDRDGRLGLPSHKTSGDPGKQLDRARRLSVGRPNSGASREEDDLGR